MKQLNNRGGIHLLVALFFGILLFLCILGTISGESPAHALGNPPVRTYDPFFLKIGGGDCSANNADGDLYSPWDVYCEVFTGKVQQKIVVYDIPTLASVSTKIPVTISTPKPGDRPENEPGELPTEIQPTPSAEITPEPTDQPTQEPTAEPTEEPPAEPTEEPEPENSCKNKNSGKDGTPAECNAGIGQEKKN